MASLRIFWEYVWVKVHFFNGFAPSCTFNASDSPSVFGLRRSCFSPCPIRQQSQKPKLDGHGQNVGTITVLFLWDQVLLWNLLKHAGYRVFLHVEPYSFPCFSDFFVIFVLQLENCHTWDCESSCSGCLLILMAIFGSLGVRLAGTNLFLCSTVAIHSAAEVSTGTPQVDPDGFRRAMVSW